MPDQNACATLVSSRLVQVGKSEDFGKWADRYEAAVSAAPGYLGLVRLEQPDGLAHFVQRFATDADLARWCDSPEWRKLHDQAEVFSADRDQRKKGDRPTFRVPSEQAAPKWKTWIATWVAVFPLLLALNLAAAPLKLPMPVQLLITSPILTAALTWYILPQVRKRLRPWLLAHDQGLRKEPD